MDDWRKWKPTDTPGAEEAEKKALAACQAALEAENHANATQKAAQEGKVELAQQEAQAAKELATKAENAYLADKGPSGGAWGSYPPCAPSRERSAAPRPQRAGEEWSALPAS